MNVKVYHVIDTPVTELPEVYHYRSKFTRESAVSQFGENIADLMANLFGLGGIRYVSIRGEDIYIQAENEIDWKQFVDPIIRDWLNLRTLTLSKPS